MKDSLISVIIPIYKVEPYLNRCVESVVNQTYKNLEIILVDDGSPDNCPIMCDDWAKRDGRIVVIHKKNGGLSEARNAGLEIAQGEWISFIDSDDFIHENMINTLHKRCITDNSDMAVCNFSRVDENGQKLPNKEVDFQISDGVFASEHDIGSLIWGSVTVWNKLCRHDLFSNIQFPAGKLHEDIFVTYRLFENCKRVSGINQILYYYVQRSDSIVGKSYSLPNLDVVEAYIKQTEHFLNIKKKVYASRAVSYVILHLLIGYRELDLNLPENKIRYDELKNQFSEIYHRNKQDIEQNSSIKLKIKIRLFFLNEQILCSLSSLKNLLKK